MPLVTWNSLMELWQWRKVIRLNSFRFRSQQGGIRAPSVGAAARGGYRDENKQIAFCLALPRVVTGMKIELRWAWNHKRDMNSARCCWCDGKIAAHLIQPSAATGYRWTTTWGTTQLFFIVVCDESLFLVCRVTLRKWRLGHGKSKPLLSVRHCLGETEPDRATGLQSCSVSSEIHDPEKMDYI